MARVYGADSDCEHDTVDVEDTAPERAGRGFVRAGADDAEDDDPGEDSDADEDSDPAGGEPGTDEEHPWRFQRPDAVWRAARLTEAASYGA